MKRYRMTWGYDPMTNSTGWFMCDSHKGEHLSRDEVLRVANDARHETRFGVSSYGVLLAIGFTVKEIDLDAKRFETGEETE